MTDIITKKITDLNGTSTLDEKHAFVVGSRETSTLQSISWNDVALQIKKECKVYAADNADTATKLKSSNAIDGVTFDGSAARSHYGICSTSAGTAAKAVSITGFTLVTGARVIVRFTYANTALSPTLNVSGTGAKAIYYKNAVIPAGYIKAYSLLEMVYDGSYWRVVGDLTQSQIDELNTNFADMAKDVTDQFSWGSCTAYKAYRLGKVVFFQAQCTAKSTSPMTFATIKTSNLYPVAATPLNAHMIAGADLVKRGVCYVSGNAMVLTTYSNYTGTTAVATAGDVRVIGHWIVA